MEKDINYTLNLEYIDRIAALASENEKLKKHLRAIKDICLENLQGLDCVMLDSSDGYSILCEAHKALTGEDYYERKPNP